MQRPIEQNAFRTDNSKLEMHRTKFSSARNISDPMLNPAGVSIAFAINVKENNERNLPPCLDP